ncbi:hypothetical protein E1200_32615 [Actinomadura sp. GC306]|uniref:DUF6416 domain-containing protein n=1 Tax=Actinomadura sp. GC306 TaxID=2530367 RepID=UPI001048F7A9|nr:DUF6416 domain-containing protein [Actinomadura sp. GC306]TDC59020.1 hypothetical protein E1200_32615 [Actinomadura sp. GC306]
MFLADDDPLWEQSSGGSGHDGREWTTADEDAALVYWEALDDKARSFLRYLFDRRGQRIHHHELLDGLDLDPEGTKSAKHVVAGSLRRTSEPNKRTGRRYPFRWWKEKSGTYYGVRTSTADIFERVTLAAQVQRNRGKCLALRLSTDQVQPFIDRLRWTTDDADVRMALGSACTTAIRAVQQLTAALQLPYNAASGWHEFLDALDERPAALREYLVVTDACQLLKHEDADLWHEAVRALHSGPHHLGGGWTTLILLDTPDAWHTWPLTTDVDTTLPFDY